MSKPTIVAVPGGWHTPEIYASTFEILNEHGYDTIGVPLPSVGADPPHTDDKQDVKAIRDCLRLLIEQQGKEAILITHSYSGIPGGDACAGLSRRDRQTQGLPGGVVRLVYIASLAMPVGFKCNSEGARFPAWMRLSEDGKVFNVTPHDARAIFYNDLSQSEADAWISKLLPQSAGVFDSAVRHTAWEHIPSTFVTGSLDKSEVGPDVVKWMVASARERNPEAFDVVETCEGAGHLLMVSRPEWLALVLRRAAGEKV